MFIVESYGLAVSVVLGHDVMLGIMGKYSKLSAQTWRYELFYWDYVIGILRFFFGLGLDTGQHWRRGRGFIAGTCSKLVWRIFGALFWVASYSMPRIYCCRLPCRWLVCRLLSR